MIKTKLETKTMGPTQNAIQEKYGYRQWLSKNYDFAKKLEDGARMLTLLCSSQLDERSGLLAEGVYAVINTIGTLNDHIISRGETTIGSKSAWALTLISNLAVVAEMLSARKGNKSKWRTITYVELLKAALRIMILIRSGWATQINDSLYMPIDDDVQRTKDQQLWWRGRRSGSLIPLPSGLSAHKFEQLKNKGTLVRSPNTPRGVYSSIGELLYIIRPVVFSLMRSKQNTNTKKNMFWAPFLLSLAIDFASYRCSNAAVKSAEKRDEATTVGGGSVPSFISMEFSRRKLLWLLYALREPFFSSVTKRATDKVSSLSIRYMLDMLYYIQRHHFYISGS